MRYGLALMAAAVVMAGCGKEESSSATAPAQAPATTVPSTGPASATGAVTESSKESSDSGARATGGVNKSDRR